MERAVPGNSAENEWPAGSGDTDAPRRGAQTDAEVLADLEHFVAEHGRWPSQLGEEPVERYLYYRARTVTDPSVTTRIRALRAPYAKRRSAEERAQELLTWVQSHDRAPKSTAADPKEREPGSWMVHRARPLWRQGRLGDDAVRILLQDPRILTARAFVDHQERFAALSAFADAHGRMPRMTEPDEQELAAWANNTVMLFETGALSADRVPQAISISALRDRFHAAAIARRADSRRARRQAEAEFAMKHGFIPYIHLEETAADFPELPVALTERMQANALELRGYIQANGHLPPADGNSAVWRMIYRARAGRMSPQTARLVHRITDGVPSYSEALSTHTQPAAELVLTHLLDYIDHHAAVPLQGRLAARMFRVAAGTDTVADQVRTLIGQFPGVNTAGRRFSLRMELLSDAAGADDDVFGDRE